MLPTPCLCFISIIGYPCSLHYFFVSHKHHRLFGHRHLCLCASFLVRLAGEGAAPFSSLHPRTRFYFLMGFPCYRHSFLFSYASSVIWVHVIFIDIHRHLCLCVSILVRIAGEGAAPSSSLHPPSAAFNFLMRFPCYLHSSLFAQASSVI